MLLYHVMRDGCISVKLTRDGVLSVKADTPPDYLVPRKIRQIDVQEALKQLLEARLWYCWENNQLYILEAPKVKILPLSIRAEKIEKGGALVVSVDGKDYVGYKEIAEAVFGGYEKNLLSELSPYLRDSFDLNEVAFVKMKRKQKAEYPIYRWRGYDLHGLNAVKKKLFWLTGDDLEKLKKLITENKQSLGEKRADQLVRLFDISYEQGEYLMTNPSNQKEELRFKYKKEVLSYIRSHELGGSVSRETAKQIFEIIEGSKR